MVILKSKQEKFEGDFKIKLRGKRLYPTKSVECLSIKIGTNLTWQYHVNYLSIKLNRANVLHFKMRKYLSILRSIDFPIFDNFISYCCLVWAQNCSAIQRILILHKEVIRISNQGISIPVLYSSKTWIGNILFIRKSLNNLSPSTFNIWFSFSSDQHNYETLISTQCNFIKLFYETNRCEKYSVTAETWNKIQKQLNIMLLNDLSSNKTKAVVTNFYLKSYY